jgi:hypothetical protein
MTASSPRFLARGILACGSMAFSLILVSACGGSPTDPSANALVDAPAKGTNSSPVIVKFTVQGVRANEPSNFADLGEAVPVSVEVSDAESAVTDLKFNWSASVGTFSGDGPRVLWKAPATAAVPLSVKLSLEVVETYASGGKAVENKVASSVNVSLHDSAREVGEMARQFLLDFSDSTIKDIPYIMRNFDPTCYGTDSETSDIAQNRSEFTIVESRVDPPVTTVQFGGICPYRSPSLAGDACAQVRSYWKSMAKKDLYYPTGALYLKSGQADIQNGVDQVAAMYYSGQQRWRLCDSAWNPDPKKTLSVIYRSLVP